MMQGKVYTVKPGVTYNAQVRREREVEKVPFKERLMDMVETSLLIFLSIVFLVSTVAVAYKSLVYFKMKFDKRALAIEKSQLEQELKRLTSREVVLEKAKQLGLRPPQESDFIRLK